MRMHQTPMAEQMEIRFLTRRLLFRSMSGWCSPRSSLKPVFDNWPHKRAHLYGYSLDICRTFFLPFPVKSLKDVSLSPNLQEKLKVSHGYPGRSWRLYLELAGYGILCLNRKHNQSIAWKKPDSRKCRYCCQRHRYRGRLRRTLYILGWSWNRN